MHTVQPLVAVTGMVLTSVPQRFSVPHTSSHQVSRNAVANEPDLASIHQTSFRGGATNNGIYRCLEPAADCGHLSAHA